MKLLHVAFGTDVNTLILNLVDKRRAPPRQPADWDKLHTKLATISAAANIDTAGPRTLLNAHPIISELLQSTGSFLKSMISVSAR